MRSTHIPEMAGDTIEVTGELEIKSGLRELQSVQLTLAEQNIVADEESKLTWYRRNPKTLPGDFVIRVEKSGAGEGSLGDSAVKVSWLALGK